MIDIQLTCVVGCTQNETIPLRHTARSHTRTHTHTHTHANLDTHVDRQTDRQTHTPTLASAHTNRRKIGRHTPTLTRTHMLVDGRTDRQADTHPPTIIGGRTHTHTRTHTHLNALQSARAARPAPRATLLTQAPAVLKSQTGPAAGSRALCASTAHAVCGWVAWGVCVGGGGGVGVGWGWGVGGLVCINGACCMWIGGAELVCFTGVEWSDHPMRLRSWSKSVCCAMHLTSAQLAHVFCFQAIVFTSSGHLALLQARRGVGRSIHHTRNSVSHSTAIRNTRTSLLLISHTDASDRFLARSWVSLAITQKWITLRLVYMGRIFSTYCYRATVFSR